MSIRTRIRIRCIIMIFTTSILTGFSEDMAQNKTPHLYETPAEKRDIAGIILRDGISMGGLIEIEASAGRDKGEDVSDIVLATFELGIEIELHDWIKGHALMLWEEDANEPVDLDEAMITMGKTKIIPYYLEAGKLYVPFGVFNSHFISDPLVLELAETRESAMLAGYASRFLDINFGAFNGNVDNENQEASDYVAALTLTPGKYMTAGIYWISDIGESDTLEEIILENMASYENDSPIYKSVAAAGGFISIQFGWLVADAEYLSAMESFAPGILTESANKPAAWNMEAGVRCSVYEAEIAIKYEGCKDLPGFPEQQFGIGSSVRISDSSTVAIEFLHGTYKTDWEKRNIVTAQFAMEF